MKELLIIRSVSIQQLDTNLLQIKSRFPDHRISLLTHEHSVELAKKYKAIDEIYVYPFKGGFSVRRKIKELAGKRFDGIVIPVGNLTGAGFFNVLLFSLSMKAKKRFICNMTSEIWETNKVEILWTGFRNAVFSVISLILTVFIGFFAFWWLLLILNQSKKDDE